MKRNVFEYDSSDEETRQPKRIVPLRINDSLNGNINSKGPIGSNDLNRAEPSDQEESVSSGHDDYMNMDLGMEPLAATPVKASLDTPMSSNSIGMKMMQKMGFKLGDTLGKNSEATHISAPIQVKPRLGRKGIGATHNGIATTEKFHPVTVSEYRQTTKEKQDQFREKRTMLQLQRFCYHESGDEEDVYECPEKVGDVNVMWRRIALDSLRTAEKRVLLFNEESREISEDGSETGQKDLSEVEIKKPNSKPADSTDIAEGSQLQIELAEFESRPIAEQLLDLLGLCRKEYFYCPYCSVRYKDESDMQENCPGPREGDHPY